MADGLRRGRHRANYAAAPDQIEIDGIAWRMRIPWVLCSGCGVARWITSTDPLDESRTACPQCHPGWRRIYEWGKPQT